MQIETLQHVYQLLPDLYSETSRDAYRAAFRRAERLTNKKLSQLAADERAWEQELSKIVWAGEFGRTPKINANTGRDHYPRAFNAAIAGGGIKGGQVIGKTSDDGSTVEETPVTVPDLLQTVCRSLNVESDKENMSPLGRPMKIVDGGKPVEQLFA